MANIALILFFLLYGILGLVSTSLPHWLIPLMALIVAICLIAGGSWWKRQ